MSLTRTAQTASGAPGSALPLGARTSIATVCLSGTLGDKLDAIAHAGFDGVEIFEPDLIAAPGRLPSWRAPRPTADWPSTSISRSAISTPTIRTDSGATSFASSANST